MHLLNRAIFGLLLCAATSLPPARAELITSPRFAVAPEVDRGTILLSELNCISCHAVDPSADLAFFRRKAPILGEAGLRITPQYLRSYLANPHQYKPGTPMPDMLHALKGSDKINAVEALTHYLVSLYGDTTPQFAGAEEYQLKQGSDLYHTVGCVACHAPQEVPSRVPGITPEDPHREKLDPKLFQNSIPLGDLARKTTVTELAKFLLDPLKVRPSGRMPSLNLSVGEANSLAIYLLRGQLNDPDKTTNAPLPGLRYHYYEGSLADSVDFDKLTPTESGTVEKLDVSRRKRDTSFGFRYSGFITVPEPGTYTFYTTSDDGSFIYIDGKMVVNNGGDHAPQERSGTIDLTAGNHALVATFWNNGAGFEFKASWKGPGFEKQEIPPTAFSHIGTPMLPLGTEPFTVDRSLADKGQQLFVTYGCASCHQVSGTSPTGSFRSLALRDLNPQSDSGCLAEQPSSRSAKYDFSDEQRTSLKKTLREKSFVAAGNPALRIDHTLAALNCFACHTRDGKGGANDARLAYFRVLGEADMGDEGRIPPHLTGVGGKLNGPWMHDVLVNGGSVRPYMATRMPQFGEGNVGHLPGLFEKADGQSPERTALPANQKEAKLGRRLAGSGGLSCISCHTFADYKSLGIPAIDLTTMTRRLRYDWFHRYLLDPPSLRPGTRMPSFWPEGKAVNKDILDGDTDAQIRVLWAYLSDGPKADLPDGLITGVMEIVADTEPVIYRNFIEGAGTRAIGVGYPEKVNLAFDANNARVAMIWQGSFIDAQRHSTGRGAGFEPPLGHNVRQFPEGAPFAILESQDDTWPASTGKDAGYKMLGYALDAKRRPTFKYQFENIRIADHFEPVQGEVDNSFKRTLTFTAGGSASNLYYRAALGGTVVQSSTSIVLDKVTLSFSGSALAGAPILRANAGQTEVLVPIKTGPGKTTLVEEIIW